MKFFCITLLVVAFMTHVVIARVPVFSLGANTGWVLLNIMYGEMTKDSDVADDGFVNVTNISLAMSSKDMDHIYWYDHTYQIILPSSNPYKCAGEKECKATVLVVSNVLGKVTERKGRRKCYDILVGDMQRDHTQHPILNLQISNLKPHGLTCNLKDLRWLLYTPKIQPELSDMFSPIEDIVNNAVQSAVTQFTATAKVYATEITDDVNDVKTQTVQLSTKMENNTKYIVQKFEGGSVEILKDLQGLKDGAMRDVGVMERYYHYFMHAMVFLGILVVIGFIAKLYRIARGVFRLLKWLGITRLWRKKDKKAKKNKKKGTKTTCFGMKKRNTKRNVS